jgi:hypothetical protein
MKGVPMLECLVSQVCVYKFDLFMSQVIALVYIYVGIIISVLTLVAMALASRYVYLTKGLFHKIKTEGVHGVFSARFKESDDVLGDARRYFE